jgi:hypothetical protein
MSAQSADPGALNPSYGRVVWALAGFGVNPPVGDTLLDAGPGRALLAPAMTMLAPGMSLRRRRSYRAAPAFDRA